MRRVLVIIALAIALGAPTPASAQQGEDPSVQFWLMTWPSAISTPLLRKKTQLFEHTLRYVFADRGTIWASHSTTCARKHDAIPLPLRMWGYCSRPPDPWTERIARGQLLPVDPADSTGKDIMVVLYAGERPEPDARDVEWDDVVALDVSATRSSELALAACELAARQRDIACELTDTLTPLEHPDDDVLIVAELHEGSDLSPKRSNWRTWHDRHIVRAPTGAGEFVVQGRVQWAMPEGSVDVRVLNHFDEPAEAVISMHEELAHLVRRDILRIAATVDGQRFAPPRMNPPDDEEPLAATFVLPPVARGDHRIEVRLESWRPDDLPIVGELHWRHERGDAGRFYECFADDAQVRHRDGLLFVERGGEKCLVAPWWNGDVELFRVDDRDGSAIVTGSISESAAFAYFIGLAFFLALAVRVAVARPASPTHVARRQGSRASYREAPLGAWKVGTIAEVGEESVIRVVPTPFGTYCISRSPVWTRQGDELLAPRRFFPILSGTLVMDDDAQLIFLSEADARDLDQNALEQALATREEMKLARAEAAFAAHLEVQRRAMRVAENVGFALVVTALALGVAHYAGLREPLLSQVTPFVGITLITSVVINVAVHRIISAITRC